MKKNSAIFFIVLLAIAIRFVYVHPFINSMPATYDGMIFDDVATNVIEHGQFRLSPDSPEKKVFYSVKEGFSWRPPVYPLFLAGIYKIFGHNFASVRIIEILIAGLTVFLVYFTGKKFFNAKTGLLASLIIVLYPPFIQFSGYFMRENILVFFMMPLLYYLLKISFNEKISYMDFLVTGVILGLTALLRTVVIVYAPLFILAFLFMRGKRFLNYVKPLTIAIIAML